MIPRRAVNLFLYIIITRALADHDSSDHLQKRLANQNLRPNSSGYGGRSKGLRTENSEALIIA